MDSLALALAFYRQPFAYPELLDPAMPLPRGLDNLLLLALDARLPETLAPTAAEESRLAARFFVQQVFFVRDASHYRVLGLNPDASDAEIKHHHRLLMRLFHPDRRLINEVWADSYAQRINEAYTVLRRTSQRHRYDLSLQLAQVQRQELAIREVASSTVLPPDGGQRIVGIPIPRSVRLPGWVLRRLPETVLGTVALIALLSVVGVYLSQQQPPVLTGSPMVEAEAIQPRTSTMPLVHPPRLAHSGASLSAVLAPRLAGLLEVPATPTTPATPAVPETAVARLDPDRLTRVPVPTPRPGNMPAAQSNADAGSPAPSESRRPPAPAPQSLADAAQVALAHPVPVEPTGSPVSKLDLEVLISLFIGAYERGDLEALMALFAEQVETNNQAGKRGIQQDYRTLFAATRRRQMSLTDMQWQRRGDNARGHGLFEVRLEGGEGQARSYAGTLRFEVQKRESRLLITGFFHRDLYYKIE